MMQDRAIVTGDHSQEVLYVLSKWCHFQCPPL